MANLTEASKELFRRTPDECFSSLTALSEHCKKTKDEAVDRWVPPRSIKIDPTGADQLLLTAGDNGAFSMNDWSFGQLCRLAGVGKETANRLSIARGISVRCAGQGRSSTSGETYRN